VETVSLSREGVSVLSVEWDVGVRVGECLSAADSALPRDGPEVDDRLRCAGRLNDVAVGGDPTGDSIGVRGCERDEMSFMVEAASWWF
jgi:hypothetical protein